MHQIVAKNAQWRNGVQPSKADDELLPLEEPVYCQTAISTHHQPRIAEILNGIRALNLPLKLFQGEASVRATTSKIKSVEVWKLANGQGYSFEFIIQEGKGGPHQEYGAIHTIWLRADVEKQGSWWTMKAFFEQVATLLLEHCGYEFLWGRAVWSSNSSIRGLSKPDMESDWRWKPVFCGWDAALRPIIHQGLVLAYLRMGFFLHPDTTQENVVVFASSKRAREYAVMNGQKRWDELTQLSLARRREWQAVQKQRAALVSQPKEKIREAIQRETDRLRNHGGKPEILWRQLNQQRQGNSLWRF